MLIYLSFFNPDLLWQDQLTSLVGSEEVEKLHKKLKSLRVAALDDYHISYSDMFSKSLCDDTENFLEIVRDIGSWPQVQIRPGVYKVKPKVWLKNSL